MLILAGAVGTPLLVSISAEDIFRLPKQLLLYAVAIASATLVGIGVAFGHFPFDEDSRRRLRAPLFLGVAGVFWALVSSVYSQNHRVSIDAVVWVVALITLLLISIYALRSVTPGMLSILFLPALANSFLLFLQASGVWNPWVFDDVAPRMMKNALLGNPDDVGVYLAAPALLAVTLSVHSRKHRLTHALVATCLALGILVSETMTAIIALGLALLVLAAHHWRRTLPVILGAMVILGSVFLVYRPLAVRVTRIASQIPEGRWDDVLSGRMISFAAAWRMFLDHPIAGVGPGCFKFAYMEYKAEAEETYPSVPVATGERARNFGEVHNDHLQLLAESGLPGYTLLVAGILVVAGTSRRKFSTSSSDRASLAYTLALPFAVLATTTMLTQFPLQIAASAYTYVVLSAMCLSWRAERDA